MMRRVLLFALIQLIPSALLAQQGLDTVTVKVISLHGGVYVLTGSGGNMGLSVGDDAAFLVDDQFAPLTTKVLAAIATVTPKPVRFVVNTHWHFDHTGGNENLGKTGALLVAHDNVRKRMSMEQFIEFLKRTEPAAPRGALPVVTFNDSMTFHLNGDDIVAFHVPPAHTDGDVLVHFARSNVIHMGDTFVVGRYPFVDLSSGGNANGIITAADRALAVCNADTKVIPGHGAAVSDCKTLREYRDMVATIRDRVRAAMRDGKSLDAIKAANLTADYDATHRGSVSGDNFVEFMYRSLAGKP
jgi:glyoxylase-like metal-dependent hydrolase (beta-lactamase superfamily II)